LRSVGSLAWRQEQQNELWIGHRGRSNEILQKDPALMAAGSRHYARLPGGHQEGWSDAFCNVIRDIYEFIAAGHGPGDPRPPAFATFEAGYRAARIVEAAIASAGAGGAWTTV
jgi:predicted dehydrogenase